MNCEKINVVCISNKKKADILELHRARYCNLTNKHEKVQVGKDQEKAQSEKDSHSKNRGGKKPN